MHGLNTGDQTKPWMMKLIELTVWNKAVIGFVSQWSRVIFKISEFFWNINSSSFVCWIKYLISISPQFPSTTIIFRPLTSAIKVKCILILKTTLILPYSIVKCHYSSCLYIKFWEESFFSSLHQRLSHINLRTWCMIMKDNCYQLSWDISPFYPHKDLSTMAGMLQNSVKTVLLYRLVLRYI